MGISKLQIKSVLKTGKVSEKVSLITIKQNKKAINFKNIEPIIFSWKIIHYSPYHQFRFLCRNVGRINFSWVETHHLMRMTTKACKNHKWNAILFLWSISFIPLLLYCQLFYILSCFAKIYQKQLSSGFSHQKQLRSIGDR